MKNVTTEIRSILTALLLVFITLKLTGHIAWSWVWVMAPMWIPLVLAVSLFTVLFVFDKLTK